MTHLWRRTHLESFEDDIHHSLWGQYITAHYRSILRRLQDWAGGNDDFNRG